MLEVLEALEPIVQAITDGQGKLRSQSLKKNS